MGRRARAGLAVLGGLALCLALGPRNRFGPDAPAPREAPPGELAQLEGWLQRGERAYGDLKPETQKRVRWAGAAGRRTPWALVYVHGFGASHLETEPVPARVAEALGANLFLTRLAGHGRSGAAMAEATPQDWLADVVEAARIGRALGDRVVLLGCSTGATLGTWLAVGPHAGLVDAYAFLSPNFGPRDKKSEIINLPWGRQLATALLGEQYRWTAPYKRVELVWTTSHPTRALFPMMALVKRVRELDLGAFRAPVLVLYSERDRVIDPAEVKAAFARIGSAHKRLVPVAYSTALTQHVLAGDATAPESVAPLSEALVGWIRAL